MSNVMALIIVITVVFLPIIAVFVVAFRLIKKYTNKIEKQYRDCAIAEGLKYQKGLSSEIGLAGVLFSTHAGTYVRNSLSYDDGIIIGQADFEINRSETPTTIAFSFASLPMKRYSKLWLVVDSLKNNVFGRSLMDTASVSQRLEPIVLEGNFRDTYKVYINQGEQVDALTALNPASMEKLVAIFGRYDMEICEGRVHIYSVGISDLSSLRVRQEVIQDVNKLRDILS